MNGEDFRVIMTGSRHWEDPGPIEVDIMALWQHTHASRRRLVLVEGECPYGGADAVVRDFVTAHPTAVRAGQLALEPHPADFAQGGRGAGPRRNQYMVSRGAHLCLGYPRGESKGTRGCMKLARDAGIPTLKTEWEDRGRAHLRWRLFSAGITLGIGGI